MRNKFFVRKIRKHSLVISLLLVLAVLLLLIAPISAQRAIPSAQNALEKVSRSEISRRVHKIVKEIIQEKAGEKCLHISYDSAGYISSVSVDSLEVSRLCSLVVSRLTDSFEKDHRINIRVPFGDVSGIGFLTGRGHNIKINAVIYPTFSARVDSNFKEAGINQTLQELTLTVSCDTVSVCAGKSVEITEAFDFILVENVIVGSVPFS